MSIATIAEVLRVEVGEEVAALRHLHEQVIARLERERSDRVGDLDLVTELIVEGWQSVDRRLGRIERMLERLELERAGSLTIGQRALLSL